MATRFGIAEWFGRPVRTLGQEERSRLARVAKGEVDPPPCPFGAEGAARPCSKAGGVCSLRAYSRGDGSSVELPQLERATICVTCPRRFGQGADVFSWIGETLINTAHPLILGQTPFLQPVADAPTRLNRAVGRLDHVLVKPESAPLEWCAVELQAVYFSGKRMAPEFDALGESRAGVLPFPTQARRPDFRSSGPKRLMPQLQIKVPVISRWGKKTAVVVDEMFFGSLAPMNVVSDVSLCEIAWFIVDVDPGAEPHTLRRSRVVLTTLTDAVSGLTAGVPMARAQFEEQLVRQSRAVSEPRRSRRDRGR